MVALISVADGPLHFVAIVARGVVAAVMIVLATAAAASGRHAEAPPLSQAPILEDGPHDSSYDNDVDDGGDNDASRQGP